jgi:hypothetical protein
LRSGLGLVADGFDGHSTSSAFLAFLFPDLEGLAVAADAWVLDFFGLAVVNGFIIEAAEEDWDLAVFYKDGAFVDGLAGTDGLILYLAEGVEVIVCGFFFKFAEAGEHAA